MFYIQADFRWGKLPPVNLINFSQKYGKNIFSILQVEDGTDIIIVFPDTKIMFSIYSIAKTHELTSA